MSEQCRFMQAAYPDLDGSDTCAGFHRHEEDVFALARALATVFQGDSPSDEQTAWFLNDADAALGQMPRGEQPWEVRRSTLPTPRGCTDCLVINGYEFVLQDSDFEPMTPELRRRYLRDRDLTEADIRTDAKADPC